MILLHVTTPDAWSAAQAAGHIEAAPFLHLCTEVQLPFVLRQHFPGRTGLLILRIDPPGWIYAGKPASPAWTRSRIYTDRSP